MSDTHKTESLHDQIMRLPRDPAEYTNVNMMLAYKDGHRDARHAAAELAAAYEADAQQAAPVAVPEGYKLVPVEPTKCMVMAGYYPQLKAAQRAEMYRAMLAAAPTPPAQQSQSSTYPRRLTEKMKEAGQRAIERAHEDGCFGLHSLGYAYAEAALDAADDGDTAAPEQAEQPHPVNRSVIRDVFLRNGFTIKEGHSDLKPYVYAAAEELLALDGKEVAAEQDAVTVPQELLRRMFKAADLLAGSDQTHHLVFKAADEYSNALSELRALLGGGE